MKITDINSEFEISIRTIMIILIVHFIADFILQTKDQASNKSSNNRYLAMHVFNYSMFTTLAWFMFFPSHLSFPWEIQCAPGHINVFWIFPITFSAHFLTDYFTSRWTKKLWEDKEVHDFFVAVGFDQFLHAVQLFYMYELLMGC